MKTPALRFSVDGKYFEKDTFLKRWAYDSHDIFLRELFSNKNPKWPVIICSVFQFLQRNLDGTHLIHFPSEASVFKFIQRGVGGSLMSAHISYLLPSLGHGLVVLDFCKESWECRLWMSSMKSSFQDSTRVAGFVLAKKNMTTLVYTRLHVIKQP